MSVVQLYDLTVDDFPVDKEFCSLQVFKCHACGALTNITWWANCRMGGAQVECPNEREGWHRRIEGLRRRSSFEVRPRAYEEAVAQEIAEILRSVTPQHRICGNPIRDWDAQAVLNDGYVVDGVGFRPHGEKRVAMSASYFPPVFPPFEAEVFQTVSRSLPESDHALARQYIESQHALFQGLRGRLRSIEMAEHAYRSSGLDGVHAQIQAQPGLKEKLDRVHSDYQSAYWRWEAERHLQLHGYRARHKHT